MFERLSFAALFTIVSAIAPQGCGRSPDMPSDSPGQSATIWSAGQESGDLSEWSLKGPRGSGGMFNSGNAQASASQDHAHSGRYSVKAIITGDGGVRLFRWNEPRMYTELYYSAWYYFPQQYKPISWWNIWQWKSRTPAGVDDPFFLLEIKNRPTGDMYLSLYNWQTHVDLYSKTSMNVPVGQWVHIEGFQKCAPDKSGQVTIWQDGVQLFDMQNVQTRYSEGDCRWSADNYSSGVTPSPTIIYIDDASISLTRP